MASAARLPGMSLSHAAFANALLPVVLEAGRVQMHYFKAAIAVQSKADKTPVTVADQESESVIVAALAHLAPGVPVVAEEAMAAGHRPPAAGIFLLVDPLDGTREFISGRGEFTVNIALIVDETPVFGIVYAPATHDLYVTTGKATVLRTKVAPTATATTVAATGATKVKARLGNPNGLTAMVSRSHMTSATEAFLARYPISERLSAGSSLKFCLLAAGEADIYPRAGPTCEWDTAAGQAVLTAAGGSVTTFEGAPLRYGKASLDYRNPDYVAWGRRRGRQDK